MWQFGREINVDNAQVSSINHFDRTRIIPFDKLSSWQRVSGEPRTNFRKQVPVGGKVGRQLVGDRPNLSSARNAFGSSYIFGAVDRRRSFIYWSLSTCIARPRVPLQVNRDAFVDVIIKLTMTLPSLGIQRMVLLVSLISDHRHHSEIFLDVQAIKIPLPLPLR